MKIRSNILMSLLLIAMLVMTLFGAMNVKNREKEKPEETPPVEDIPVSDVLPDSFKGQISDDFGVPEQVMKTIADYMDGYYLSLCKLETADISELFENEKMAKISEKAISLLVNVRKMYDFDLSLKGGHYDLKVTGYRNENGRHYVDILEDDYMYFAFLNGIESSSYDIENSFVIDENNKIIDLEKVQGYYLTFYDEKEKSVDEVYDYYINQLKDLTDYNMEVLRRKAQSKPYESKLSYGVAYDRSKAVSYSNQYYHERNPKWYNFTDEGGNCQNYASQSMLEGGILMDNEGEAQWKCYIEDPEFDPEINEEETASGRSRSWVNVEYFYEYARDNEGKGLVADVNINSYYCEPGDIVIVGNASLAHTVIVSKVVDGHVLVNSNSIDMKDYPLEAYVYTNIMAIKILGYNK